MAGALAAHGFSVEAFRGLAVSADPVTPAVEVVNDSVTTFQFVVDALRDFAEMDDRQARAFARAVDTRGRDWFGASSDGDAERIGSALVERARAAGFPLEAHAVVEQGEGVVLPPRRP